MTVFTGVISYPIPAYQNVPIHAHYYKPRRFVISDIILGQTTLIETTHNMDYVIGQEIRLIIPPSFGCRQFNEQRGFVLTIPAPNQVEVSIDSSQYDEYISSNATTVAQILAIGDINNGAINDCGRNHQKTYIPGSFRDISPK